MTSLFKIYCPAKTAMQSGRGKTIENTQQHAHVWVGEYVANQAQRPENLMGWNGSGDTQKQIKLQFDTVDSAIAYAKKNNLNYIVEYPKQRIIKPKSYADNFSYHRQMPWTH